MDEIIESLEKETTALEKQLQEQPFQKNDDAKNRLGSLIAHLVHCENLF